jgi:hypothetical protein
MSRGARPPSASFWTQPPNSAFWPCAFSAFPRSEYLHIESYTYENISRRSKPAPEMFMYWAFVINLPWISRYLLLTLPCVLSLSAPDRALSHRVLINPRIGSRSCVPSRMCAKHRSQKLAWNREGRAYGEGISTKSRATENAWLCSLGTRACSL